MSERTTILFKLCIIVWWALGALCATAQSEVDSVKIPIEKKAQKPMVSVDSIDALDIPPNGDKETYPINSTDSMPARHKRDGETWTPSPKRALWLALVLPGAGQIYNRKLWKLPIIYGGFVGCAYAMRWNNMMYRDYSQAYLDIMDDDPNTHSYNQFLHLGNQVTPENMKRWQDIFRKRKDRYRRWRDLSFFALIGVYALSVVDAYVDASLSEFDISPDLSMRVAPTIIHGGTDRNPVSGLAMGLQCCLTF